MYVYDITHDDVLCISYDVLPIIKVSWSSRCPDYQGVLIIKVVSYIGLQFRSSKLGVWIQWNCGMMSYYMYSPSEQTPPNKDHL